MEQKGGKKQRQEKQDPRIQGPTKAKLPDETERRGRRKTEKEDKLP
jgi:hypothetical protein